MSVLVNENSRVRKNKQNRLMLSSNCAICGKTKMTFIEIQEINQELKNSTTLIIFEMINFKRITSLTHFFGLEINLCQNCI